MASAVRTPTPSDLDAPAMDVTADSLSFFFHFFFLLPDGEDGVDSVRPAVGAALRCCRRAPEKLRRLLINVWKG